MPACGTNSPNSKSWLLDIPELQEHSSLARNGRSPLLWFGGFRNMAGVHFILKQRWSSEQHTFSNRIHSSPGLPLAYSVLWQLS